MRNSGVIFRSTLETCLDMVYDGEEEMAFHYLLTAVEKTLDADITYDDPRLKYVYGELDRLIAKSHDRFDKKIQDKEQASIDHYQLEEIAEMFFGQGLTQRQIAEKLGDISQQGVSGRIKMIRSKYPELMKKYNPTTNFTTDTTRTTDTTGTSESGCITTDTTNFTTDTTDTTNFTTLTTDTTLTTGTIENGCSTTGTTEFYNRYNSYNQYNSYNGYNSNVNVNDNVNDNSNVNVDNNVNGMTVEDFEKRVYVNSYDEECTTTGYEILEDYNFDNDDEVIEMSNEFPEAYEDLIKLGVIKRKQWVF